VQGNPGLAIGNAIGSNIANIGLILGTTALLVPLTVHSDTLVKEFPLLLGVSFTATLLMLDDDLSRLDGLLLLVGLAVALSVVVRIGLARKARDPLEAEYDAEIPKDMSMANATWQFVLGLAVLLVSSRALVWGAVNIATEFGVSDLVIGLTIVAVGTSLPELAASIAGALKNEHDIAIGNILGSNLYNLLAVLCMPGLIAPSAIPPEVLQRDLPVMLVLTLALFLMAQGLGHQGRINRIEAAVLLAGFIGYQAWVFLDATRGMV
jgi:cation:H+ antiporter